jgi:hypothetical protein
MAAVRYTATGWSWIRYPWLLKWGSEAGRVLYCTAQLVLRLLSAYVRIGGNCRRLLVQWTNTQMGRVRRYELLAVPVPVPASACARLLPAAPARAYVVRVDWSTGRMHGWTWTGWVDGLAKPIKLC